MGRRFVADRLERAGIGLYATWPAAHTGKYWKRQMHKARRRAWKQDGKEGTPNNKYETFCDYKTY